jgi:hypothetical protein
VHRTRFRRLPRQRDLFTGSFGIGLAALDGEHQAQPMDDWRRRQAWDGQRATDDIGYEAVENRVSLTDWHATILHLLGLDYRKLVFD